MHKVDVWLPTMTYNKLKDRAMVQGQDISQLASNGLYRAINCNSPDLVSWYIPMFTGMVSYPAKVVDILGKFILATLKTGISQDDIMMNGLDSNVSYEEIAKALSYMLANNMIEVEDGIIKYKYYSPIEKQNVLSRFKDKKVDSKVTKIKTKRESLVKKLKPKGQ